MHRGKLAAADIEQRTGYRITTPLRTLVDVAEDATSQEHLNRAVQRRLSVGLFATKR